MNHIVISGRLVRDPETRYTQTGKCVTQITVAVDKFTGGQKSAIFVPCVFWDRQAEFVGNYFVKGQQIIVEGSLNIRSYEKDGTTRYVTEIEARRAEFCGPRGNSTQPEQNAPQTANAAQPSAFDGMGQSFGDEEIPF